jgi:hypothetical protein
LKGHAVAHPPVPNLPSDTFEALGVKVVPLRPSTVVYMALFCAVHVDGQGQRVSIITVSFRFNEVSPSTGPQPITCTTSPQWYISERR